MRPEEQQVAIAKSVSYTQQCPCGCEACHNGDGTYAPPFFREASAAVQLIANLAAKGWRCTCSNGLDTTWECTFYKAANKSTSLENLGERDGATEEHYGCGDTLAEAICGAFLRVIKEWKES